MSKLSSRLIGAAGGALMGFTAGSLGGAAYYEPKFHKRRKAGDKLSYRKDVIDKSFDVAKKGALVGALLGGLKGINEMNIDQMIESVRNGADPEMVIAEALTQPGRSSMMDSFRAAGSVAKHAFAGGVGAAGGIAIPFAAVSAYKTKKKTGKFGLTKQQKKELKQVAKAGFNLGSLATGTNRLVDLKIFNRRS